MSKNTKSKTHKLRLMLSGIILESLVEAIETADGHGVDDPTVYLDLEVKDDNVTVVSAELVGERTQRYNATIV